MKMTAKQEKFCNEYLIDLNATQAAIRAGYSKKTAAVIAAQNLIKLNVQTFIQDARKVSSENAGITRDMVLDGYKKLAFYDARKFYDATGNLVPIQDLDDETAFALIGFDIMQVGSSDDMSVVVRKIKMNDKKSTLDSIAKMLGYNEPDKSELTVNGFIDFLKETSNDK